MFNIGIDLGGTNIKVGVVDENYNIIGKSNIKTNLPRPSEAIADSIVEGVEQACKAAGIAVSDVNSIGIGTPGVANRKTGIVLHSSNLGFENFALGEYLSQKLGTHISAFDTYMQKLGSSLGTTVNHYNTAYKSLSQIDKDVVKITTGESSIEVKQIDKPSMEEV